MTTFNLPEGMTAEKLREHAAMLRADGWATDLADPFDAWADAIDPPEPGSVVTDEMVDEVIDSMPQNLRSRTIVRAVLEAVERLGWLRDLKSAADNPSSSEPWPTDEQVLAAAKALYASVKNPLPWESDKEWWIGRARTALEAVAPPPVVTDEMAVTNEGTIDGVPWSIFWKGEARRLANKCDEQTERLEIAERLLRRVLTNFPDSVGWSGRVEAEYLRSLDGEGDGDE